MAPASRPACSWSLPSCGEIDCDGLLAEGERQRAVVQHVGQVGGLSLAEAAGDLGRAAGDGPLVDGREGDDVAVQHHGQVVQRRARGPAGPVLAVHLLGQRRERVAPGGVEGEVGLPVHRGRRHGGTGRLDVLAQYLRLVQHELVEDAALPAAGHGLDVLVVVLRGVAPVADLPLPVLIGAVQLVELRLDRCADQAGITGGAGQRGHPAWAGGGGGGRGAGRRAGAGRGTGGCAGRRACRGLGGEHPGAGRHLVRARAARQAGTGRPAQRGGCCTRPAASSSCRRSSAC